MNRCWEEMLEMDSISSNPSLVPWGGVEAKRSWVWCPESRRPSQGRGESGGKPSAKREYLFVSPSTRNWDGEGERHRKERSEKRETSSRAQRGCGLDCGLNQFHKECEKYEEVGSVRGRRGARAH